MFYWCDILLHQAGFVLKKIRSKPSENTKRNKNWFFFEKIKLLVLFLAETGWYITGTPGNCCSVKEVTQNITASQTEHFIEKREIWPTLELET